MRILSTTSWIFFGVGIASILALQIIAITIVYPNWGWNKSYFAQHFFWPSLVLAFVLCMAAPFFTARPMAQRFVAALLAGLTAALVYFGSSLAFLVLYGA